MIINTHCHIYDEAFDADREEAFQRALDAGVEMLLLPNTDELSIKPMMDFYEKHPENVRVMMGLHPESVKEDYVRHLGVIEDTLNSLLSTLNSDLVGIGEIGLDFYWDRTFEKQQVDVLHEQLKWAKELGLPVSVHTRNAFPEMFRVIDNEQDGRLRGVMHCFNGTFDEAKTALSYGFALGIGGVITYKNCFVRDFLNEMPLESIVLETDDPYLPPVPYRGKRNEPAYIVKTAEKVAEIYNLTLDEIINKTTENASALFKVPAGHYLNSRVHGTCARI